MTKEDQVSVQSLYPFLIELFVFFIVDFYKFLIYFVCELLIGCIIGKYIILFSELSSHVADGFLCCICGLKIISIKILDIMEKMTSWFCYLCENSKHLTQTKQFSKSSTTLGNHLTWLPNILQTFGTCSNEYSRV